VSRLGFALAMLAVVAAAAWAYNVNYQTKMALARVERLHAGIAAEREALEVLRVEWAYLNAPDRLARLVAMNNDRLDLVPMGPQHFDEVAAVPFPPNPPPQPPADDPAADPASEPASDPAATVAAAGLPSEAPSEAPPEPPLLVSGEAAAAMPLPTPRPASWRPQ